MGGNIEKLRNFVVAATRIVDRHGSDEAAVLAKLKPLVATLVAVDDWLADDYAAPDPRSYRQYLLYADPLERLSIVSFVWGAGQRTPVHNHTVWGIVGVLRGADIGTDYGIRSDGGLQAAPAVRLEAGSVVAVSPSIGDIHAIANAYDDRTSISLHLYGGNIGTLRRSVFDPDSGRAREFVSGYSNDTIPNLWGRSR